MSGAASGLGLSSAKERRLNQFGTAVLIWCGKHRLVRQGLPNAGT